MAHEGSSMESFVSRTVFDSLSEQIIIINTQNYTIVDVNRALLESLNLKREEVVGRTCYEATHNRSTRCAAPNDICPISEMLKTGRPITVEHIHYDANCKQFYVEVSASPIKDKEGNITHAIHIAKDISERKRLEKDLLRFKQGVERAGEVVFITETDGTIVYVNPMFEKIYGYTKEEALGKTPRILKSGTLSQQVYKQFWDTLLADKIQSGEIINRTKDNRLLTIEGTSSPISDEHGKTIGFLAIQRDVTERKKTEEALKQSRQRLQDILESIADDVYSFDRDWNFIYVNKRLANDWGYKLEDLIGKNVWRTFPRFIGTAVEKNFCEVMQKRESRHFEWQPLYTVGLRELTVFPSAEGITVHGKDITERKRIEETLRQAQAKLQEYATNLENLVEERTKQLRDSERLAAIGQVAGMVGHDIRNPLQAIIAELYFAKQTIINVPQSEAKEEALESIDSIKKQVDYINKIVADLQDYAKPLKPELIEVDVYQLIGETLKTITVPSNIQASWSCEEAISKLKLDPTFMMRILTNLANNAIQAMSNGGKLTINVSKKDNRAIIVVEDTGVGIPKETQAKLFTPMFTTKAKGQGFGLAVVKRLVEAQNGTISFESQVDKGTKFIVSLPIQQS